MELIVFNYKISAHKRFSIDLFRKEWSELKYLVTKVSQFICIFKMETTMSHWIEYIKERIEGILKEVQESELDGIKKKRRKNRFP